VRGGKELFIVKRWTRSESKNGFRGGNCTTVFFLELKKRERVELGRVGSWGRGWSYIGGTDRGRWEPRDSPSLRLRGEG